MYIRLASDAQSSSLCHHGSLEIFRVLMADSRVRCGEEDQLVSRVAHTGVHMSPQGQSMVMNSL